MAAPDPPGDGTDLAALGPGWTLDRYLLLEELDADDPLRGRARRFVALDGHYMAEVALTMFPAAPGAKDRLMAEANIARQREGQLVPKLLRAGDVGGILFLAASYTPTLSLETLQRTLGGGIRADLLVRLLWNAVRGLSELHGRGLVHGDLRPRNLLLSARGEFRLGGFLPARHSLGILAPEDGIRQDYLPPEWQERGVYLAASDVYSLALTTYAVLGGKHLLAKGDAWDPVARMRQLEGRLESKPKLPVPVTPKLGATLGAMLRFDPSKRPENVLGLLPAFEMALGGTSFKRPIAEVAAPAMLYPMARARSQRIGYARDALERGHPLGAASSLRRMASLGIEPGSWEAREAREMLTEALWHALPPGPSDDPGATLRALAIALLAYRAARHLADQELVLHTRRLLAHWSDAEGPLKDLRLPTPGGDERATEQAGYLARLHYDPMDSGALLGMATLEPARVPSGDSLAARRGAFCHALGLPAAGICHLARDLAAGHATPARLSQIAAWAVEASGAGPAAESPPSESARAAPPEESQPPLSQIAGIEDEVAMIHAALEAGKLREASEALEDLSARGEATREENHGQIHGVLRRFLWAAMLPTPESQRKDKALLAVRRIAKALDLRSLLTICEHMIVGAIPEDGRAARLRRLLEEAPGSVPVLQAAGRLAVGGVDDPALLMQLIAAGETFVEIGELRLASQMFMAAKAIDPENEAAAQGMTRVMAAGEEHVAAGEKWREIEARLAAAESPADALGAVEGFLAAHPNFRPALEAGAKLWADHGDLPRASRIFLDLAVRAMLREEEELATRCLHRVLRLDLENDEALMTLAALRPPGYDAPRELWMLKVSLLEREGLWEAAIHQTRDRLRGDLEDFQVQARLVQLHKKAGRDPSAHLLAQAGLALEMEDRELAQDCVREAIETTRDRNALIDELVLGLGADAGFSARDLLAMKH